MNLAWKRAPLVLCAAVALIPCFAAQRDSLRSRANQAFDAEMAREKAGDCPNAHNTHEFNICYGKAVATTDENLKLYEEAIRDLLGQPDSEPPTPGPAGPNLTSQQLVAEFDRLEPRLPFVMPHRAFGYSNAGRVARCFCGGSRYNGVLHFR